MSRLESSLRFLLKILLMVSLFAPLIYASGFIFPYIVPRTVFFQLTTELMALFLMPLFVFFPSTRPKRTPLLIAIGIFLSLGLLTTLTSADPIKSWMGTMERSFGFFHLLHYSVFFLTLITVLKTQQNWLSLIAVSLILSVYSATDFLAATFHLEGSVPPSITGNPTFLAVYLTFHVFFAAWLATQIQKKWLSGGLILVIGILIAAIIATGVRGAFIGLCASGIFLVAWSAWKLPRWRILLLSGVALLIGAYFFLFLNRNHELVRHNFIASRITNFSAQDSTILSRLAMWKIALRGLQDRPIVGWGRENYSLVFNAHYDSSFDAAGVSEGWEDRAHNVVFDELTQGGILGFLAYLGLLLAAMWTIRREPLLIALLIAYSVQNLFGVDGLHSYLPFFIFLGLAQFLSGKQISAHHSVSSRPYSLKTAIPIMATALILVPLGSFYFTIQPAQANRQIYQAYLSLAHNNYAKFEKSYDKGIAGFTGFPSLQIEATGILAGGLIQNGSSFLQAGTYQSFEKKFEQDFLRLTPRSPLEERWTFVFARLLLQTSILTKDLEAFEKGNELTAELFAKTPQRRIYKEMAIQAQEIANLIK